MKHINKLTYVGFVLAFSLMSLSALSIDNEKLGLYEKLDEYLPDSLMFTDENYNTVNLKDLIDKPTVLVMVYYECPGLCSPLLEGVADVISKADVDLGTEYQVFTISFNHLERPKLAQDKKKTYSKLVKNKDVSNGWTWFVGDSVNIQKLLSSIGYQIKKEGKEYIHPGALVVVSPEAKITRYLHGLYFLPFDFKMAIVEAAEGRSGPTINKVLQFCFSYDPEGKKYVFNITKVSGSIILIAALALFAVLFFRKNKDKKSIKA